MIKSSITAAKEAAYYEKLAGDAVHCLLCPQSCRIVLGRAGLCGARRNEGGLLIAASYGAVTALSLDPIEKKPLRRFCPGAFILSMGSYGCNLRCPFCQNHGVSTGQAHYRLFSPEELTQTSLETAERGNIGLAYTYNEPLIAYEFVRDTAALVRAQGQKNVLVTNGYINPGPLAALLPLIDALNIDLKAFNEDFYQQLGGRLAPVLNTIVAAHKAGCHVEVTTLIIAGQNDSRAEIEALSRWLAALSPQIPLHISRFFPAHQWRDKEATPVATVYDLAEAAREHLEYVYTGNC